MLIGHLPDAGLVHFEEPGTGIVHAYGSPATAYRDHSRTYRYPFSVVDNSALVKSAVDLFQSDPGRFLRLSVVNVGDLFFGNLPWPVNQAGKNRILEISEALLFWLGFLPATGLSVIAILRGRAGALDRGMLLVPIAGISAMSFLTLGEARFRVPFDGLLMMVSISAISDAVIRLRKGNA